MVQIDLASPKITPGPDSVGDKKHVGRKFLPAEVRQWKWIETDLATGASIVRGRPYFDIAW